MSTPGGLPVSVIAVLLALALAGVYLLVLNAIDRYEREPTSILLSGVVLGALGAPLVAATVFAVMGRGFSLPLDFAAGGSTDAWVAIVEESVKGVLLLGFVFLIRDEFDDVLDGIVYGAALGAGFGTATSLWFALGGTGLLDGDVVLSLSITSLNHAFYGAVFGGIVGYARWLGSPGRIWTVILLGLATAALLHAVHDTLPAILSRVLGRPDALAAGFSRTVAIVINLLGIGTILVAAVLYWRREAAVLRVQLRDEVDSGVVSKTDYETITSNRRTAARQAAVFRSSGWQGFISLHRLYAAEAELAFMKRRLEVRHRRRPDEARLDELRTRIGKLQAEINEGAPE